MPIGTQLLWLFVLAIPVATVTWTITHEEIFREPREYFGRCSKQCGHWYQRKFFYLFTCEFCFSHYVSLGVLLLSGYRLWSNDWRGFVLAWFGLVWIANQYMAVYNRLRLEIKVEGLSAKAKEKALGK